MKITTGELATLLKQAQQAHHEYEEQNTESVEQDKDWSAWYASYIEDKLQTFQNSGSNHEVHDEL